MDIEKLEAAISHLRSHYSNVDNLSCIYDHYSPMALKIELQEIEDSIEYLESLLPE